MTGARKRGRVRMKLRLPKSHIRFYRRVSRAADVPVSDVIAVFMGVYILTEKAKERASG